MKIWVDDIRMPPENYDCIHTDAWVRSVDTAKKVIKCAEETGRKIEIIDIDHDAGDYAEFGGDYIKLLDWLEETERSYPIHIHSMNVVGAQNMRATIQKNGWKEI